MISISSNLLYLILFVVGLVATLVLFLFTPKNNVVTMLIDIARTLVVGVVFILLIHFFGGGYVGASTVMPYLMGVIIALAVTTAIHNKCALKRSASKHRSKS